MGREKSKGGPVVKIKKQQILTELKHLIETNNGDIGLKYEELAQQFQTTRQTISNYIDELYDSVPPEDVNKTFIDFRRIFAKLHNEIEQLLYEAESVKERIEVIKTYVFLMEKKTDLLERFFAKAKAADTLNVNQQSVYLNINIDPDSMDYIKDLENRRR